MQEPYLAIISYKVIICSFITVILSQSADSVRWPLSHNEKRHSYLNFSYVFGDFRKK